MKFLRSFFFYDLNKTALSLAAELNHQEIIKFLLSQEGVEIGENCFSCCQKLTEITIPSFLTSI